ncbi:glycosyltransferase family 2 protein [soil metagenome]
MISAVIITKNEERHIGKCLTALKNVADEILIVDSFSTDKTVQICREAGARVLTNDLRGFGAQKKYGADRAAYDNIISLDADEILTPEAASEINAIKQNDFTAVYEIARINYYFTGFLSRKEFKKRIFNRRSVNWNDAPVHEELNVPAGYPIKKLTGIMHHYSYHSVSQFVEKANLYAEMGANDLFNKNKRSYIFKILFSPSFAFIQTYIFKGAFVDGFHGLIVSMLNGYATFLKYVKLRELCKKRHQ